MWQWQPSSAVETLQVMESGFEYKSVCIYYNIYVHILCIYVLRPIWLVSFWRWASVIGGAWLCWDGIVWRGGCSAAGVGEGKEAPGEGGLGCFTTLPPSLAPWHPPRGVESLSRAPECTERLPRTESTSPPLLFLIPLFSPPFLFLIPFLPPPMLPHIPKSSSFGVVPPPPPVDHVHLFPTPAPHPTK